MQKILKQAAAGAAAILLAVGLTAAPVSAASGFSGASYTPEPTNHHGQDRQFHLANGDKLPVEQPSSKDEAAFVEILNLAASYEVTRMDGTMSVLYMNVGETVYLHTSQEDFELYDSVSNWMCWSIYHTKWETVVDKNLADMTPDDLYKTRVTAQDGSPYDRLCLEWSVTAESEGVDYLVYRCGPTAEMHLKVVVGGGSGQSAASTSSSNTASTSDSGAQSSTSSSSGNAGQTTTSAGGAAYTVQAGDTLATIALNYYGDYSLWPELQRVNQSRLNQTANGLIYAGFQMELPDVLAGVSRVAPPTAGSGETLYTVQAGDTLGAIALSHYGNMSRYQEIYNRNADRLADAHTLYEGQIIVLP